MFTEIINNEIIFVAGLEIPIEHTCQELTEMKFDSVIINNLMEYLQLI